MIICPIQKHFIYGSQSWKHDHHKCKHEHKTVYIDLKYYEETYCYDGENN